MTRHHLIVFTIIFCCIARIGGVSPATAQSAPPTPIPAQSMDVKSSLARTLAAEQERKTALENEWQRVEQLRRDVDADIRAYSIQLSTYHNLLAVENMTADELQHIRKATRATLDTLESQIQETQSAIASSQQAGDILYEQYTRNQRQLDDIQAAARAKASPDPQTVGIIKMLEQVTVLLEQNHLTAKRLQQAQNELLTNIQGAHEEFRALAERIASLLETRKRRELLERNTDIASLFSSDQLRQDIVLLKKPFDFIEQSGGLLQVLQNFFAAYGLNLMNLALVLTLFVAMLFKFRRFLKQLPLTITLEKYPCRNLLFRMLERSFPLLGGSLSLCVYARMHQEDSINIVLNVMLTAILLLLLNRWARDILNFWSRDAHDERLLRCLTHVRRLTVAIPLIALFNKLLYLLFGHASLLFLLERFILEAWGLVWTLTFSKLISDLPAGHTYFTASPKRQQTLDAALVGLAYFISAGGILMELSGYAALAQYWYVGWLRTAAVSLWGFLLFAVIQEWEQHVKTMDTAEQSGKSHQIEWLVFRLSWVLLPLLVFTQLLIAWGEQEVVKTNLLKILTYTVPLGSMKFSILRLVYGGIALILISFLVRIWRWMLTHRIFIGSGLQKGVQASITTLSVYSIWFFGVMVGLNVIGIDTTTLTVAFGALGIGIGFGLQSIFNNFISGLILLFERPIEIGNVLEINGVWGTVETINVRSTVIRTFDNSAIILPNSEIITHQVTNWTFRDMRMRRTIQVGAAYGSDPKLIEHTLYDIAQKHPRVLTDPAPMVLFSDFGDNALMFKLQVWTLLDYGVATETDIRFEIERVFKEKNQQIAFPKLNAHLHQPQTPDSNAEIPDIRTPKS